MRRLPRPLRWLAAGVGAAAMAWLGGLAWFAQSSYSLIGDRTVSTDAIVVLTGGRLRLESGIDLFGAGRARKLFISGVNQRVDREALVHIFAPVADRATCCIVLGHDSDNTFGNARETAHWMRAEGFASLRLVTSWYHMKRSLIEFRRAMPGITIVASPVFARGDDPDHAGAWVGAALLTIGEFNKFLAVLLRPIARAAWPGVPGVYPSDAAERTATAASAR